MALVSTFEDKVPGWMRRSWAAHWLDLIGGLALTLDALIDGAFDLALAGFPGQVDLPGVPGLGGFDSIDALPFIGRDRRIARGFTETHAGYAERLRTWRQSWAKAGTAPAMLEQLAGVLGPNPPRLRLVSSGHRWWTREPDGVLLYQSNGSDGVRYELDGTVSHMLYEAYPWDWDSHTIEDSLGKGDASRLWLIVYAPTNPPLDGTEGMWGDGTSRYGDGALTADVKTVGTTATEAWVELIRGVTNDWRAAGVVLSHLIVAFDPDSFDPLSPTGLPDGYWGQHSKVDGDNKVRSRLATARYMRGVAGTRLA